MVKTLPIRFKVILIIASIVIGITLSSLGLGFLVSQTRFLETVEGDITVSSRIAETMISNEIGLIKEKARSTAELAALADRDELDGILQSEFEWHHYIGLVVLDTDGIIASRGEVESYEQYRRSRSAARAFQGQTVLATTRITENGRLILRITIPITGTGRTLVAILPGTLFADMVSEFRIWETGGIFIIDAEGVMIANYRPDTVLERRNYIERGETDPRAKSAADFYRTMLQGGSGIGTYTFDGKERLCAYLPIDGSDGWMLGVSAPLQESPLAQLQDMLIFSSIIFLALGLLAAFFAANSIAVPFEQIKEQNRRLEELKKTAESASESKSHFLANMSHEMRTPLNAIIGLSELQLSSEELPENNYNNVEKIYISGMTLLGIINDILDISKIEAGKFTLVPAEYEVPSMINDTVIQNMIRIGSKPIVFKLHLDEKLPLKLIGDELRLKQIFNNILSNSFKYTKEGRVDWYLSSEIDGNDVWLTSRVQDTGIGIREEDIKRLFIDFNQVDIKSNRKIEGTGLGLSITKNLVELMEGSITVESEYGKGSTFSLRIRQQYVNDQLIGRDVIKNLSEFNYTADRRSRKDNLVRAYLPYANVLVVDDVSINLDVAKGMMEPYGMTVDCVDSGQKAIDLVREGKIKYNAIFMDHMMPEMDGFEAVRIIRNEIESEYAKTVPIIALTANAILGNEDLFLKSGFHAFLSKPIDILQMDVIINRYARNKNLEKELSLPKEAPDANREQGSKPKSSLFEGKSVPGIDFSTGLGRLKNNEKTYLGILAAYLAQIRAVPGKIQSFAANTTKDTPADYKILMHSLKGTSYTIGAEDTGKLAEELERAVGKGDIEFINTHIGALLDALETLGVNLADFLDQAKKRKPQQAAPDPALLTKVLEASIQYDMGQLDAAMDELERYDYESGSDLIIWLREKIADSELEKIQERLSKEGKNG
ncbi:ATP-binding protein [Treponema primitia]|uniref:hybrid sensor histidine kinase/response regulator n=1 Tax=Treponema primitia TaxID=88058 RepID=UPI003980534E